ncbi:MAG: VIT1/CCC1 transporter family protein [Anaerolineae bacterium]|nr:VIT1/CCC1 transporter family protein [Anaerolineae bacterium]
MNENKIKTYLDFWDEEMTGALLYGSFSDNEKDPRLAEVYRRMAESEFQHAGNWAEKIKALGGTLPEFKPGLRTRILISLSKRFGPAFVLPGLVAQENQGVKTYNHINEKGMARDERSHAMLITQITHSISGGFEGGALAMLEGRHRATGGNALRAAVLGANDGMVSNLSLVMGVAGAALDSKAILITGLAGMLAGAISMALGEWLSVQSSRELYSHQIKIESGEIDESPEEEVGELALIYEARGLPREQAESLARQLMSNPHNALDTLAREELGINPEELGGSAWEATITSFLLFAVGAIVPVFPFIFFSGFTAVIVSILFSTVGLFILGAIITLFTGRSVIYSGARMVIFGLLAAAVTFGIGRLIGVSIG